MASLYRDSRDADAASVRVHTEDVQGFEDEWDQENSHKTPSAIWRFETSPDVARDPTGRCVVVDGAVVRPMLPSRLCLCLLVITR